MVRKWLERVTLIIWLSLAKNSTHNLPEIAPFLFFSNDKILLVQSISGTKSEHPLLMKMTLPLKSTQFVGPLLLVLVSCIAFLFEPSASVYFELNRDWPQSHEYYRLVTGHFMHTNALHLLFNVVGVILLWLLHGDDYKAPSYLMKFIVICILVSLLLYQFAPSTVSYVGLSGAIHGVFAWGCVRDIENKVHSGWLLLLGLLIKVGNEQLYGAGTLMPNLIEADVAIDSHLYGSILGLIIGVLTVFYHLYQRRK